MSHSKNSRKVRRFFSHKKFLNPVFLIVLGVIVVGIISFSIYKLVLVPQIHLKGGKSINLAYLKEYKEKGYKATFLGKNVTKEVKVKGKVNEKKLGSYKIIYEVDKGFFKNKVKRTVYVKDLEKPKLEVSDEDLYLCPGDEVVPEKIKASDNYDGDLSKKVKNTISKENDSITYSVTDSSGNTKSVTKKILYEDKTPPVITLNGKETMYVFVGEGFTDPGVTVEDNCDKDIQSKVKVEGSVDSNTLGEYNLTYSVEDNFKNQASVSRKVIVRKRGGIIYLTFDDGPNSGTTNVILDILKEEGVKATFFVTGYGPDELIKREYDEGHTVALHTNVHDYARVYASDEAYFEDLYAIQERVKRITGVESKIIRFPGGSSNTVSRHYSTGIMSRLTKEVVNRGFKYYDWNVSSGDAGNTTLASGVYNNVISGLRPTRENMVLMHDVKSYTRDALRDIIRYGKENGYIFEKITMDTDMVTQRVNN